MARPSSIRRGSCAGETSRCVAASGGHNRWRQVVVHRRLATLRRVELQRRIAEGTGEFLLFALTPPRLTTEPEHARQIAAKTLERLRPWASTASCSTTLMTRATAIPRNGPFRSCPRWTPPTTSLAISSAWRYPQSCTALSASTQSNSFSRGSANRPQPRRCRCSSVRRPVKGRSRPLCRGPTNYGVRCAQISCSEVWRSQSATRAEARSTSVCSRSRLQVAVLRHPDRR